MSTVKKTMYHLAMTATLTSLLFAGVPLFASETDDRIEASAKQSYAFKTYLKGDDINVQSKGGAVTLTGTVNEGYSKKLAEVTVAGLPGVVSVDNKLVEKGEAPAKNTDAWLLTQVQTTLWFHRNVNATETQVFATDGIVTLHGKATSLAQKDLTTLYVKDIEGVKDVKNEMVVSPDAMQPGKKTAGEKMDAISESIDDASITALVKMTLLYHRSTSALKTTVETKDGVVILGGKAANIAEKDLTTRLVNDVHGVEKVVNTMTVEETKS
jgi:hyperosmotically inducible periplasmic protein